VVGRVVILIVWLALIAEAVISLIGQPSEVSFTPWPSALKLTAPLWAALAAVFVAGGLLVLTAAVIVSTKPEMAGWIALIAAWLGAMLGIAALRGDGVLLRATLPLGGGLLVVAILWRVFPIFFVMVAPPNPDPFSTAMLQLTEFAIAFGVAVVFTSALLDDFRAGIALGFAGAALAAAYHALVQLRSGRPLESESRFGGLGGGGAGWRLSSTGSFVLLAMIFAAAAAAVASGIGKSANENPPAAGAGALQHSGSPGENPAQAGKTGH